MNVVLTPFTGKVLIESTGGNERHRGVGSLFAASQERREMGCPETIQSGLAEAAAGTVQVVLG